MQRQKEKLAKTVARQASKMVGELHGRPAAWH
jgi:hypothetical protein